MISQVVKFVEKISVADPEIGSPSALMLIWPLETSTELVSLIASTDTLTLILYRSPSDVKFDLDPDPEFRSKLAQNRYLGHYVVQVLHTHTENVESLLKLSAKTVLFGASHRDRFIFFGKFMPLTILFSAAVLKDLKFKIAVNVDSARYLREPKVFDGSAYHVLEKLPYIENRDVNLRGRNLKVAAAPIPPYITFDPLGSINGGAHYLMLEHYGEKYNYSMKLDTETVKGTGIFRNGLWNGMTGAVYYRVADLSIMMGGTVERYGVIDFISFQDDVVFFITRPPNARIKWQAIVYPYRPSAWLAIALSYIAVTITLYLKLWVKKTPKRNFYAIFIPYQILLDQGFEISIPGRIKRLTALWMFFVIVISTGYRSDLVSYFSFPAPESIPRDFEALDRRADYKVLFNYHAGTAFQYFDSAQYGAMQRIRQRFELQPDTAACGISAALEPHTVCICWGLVIRPIISGNLSLPGAFKPMIVFGKPAVTFPIGFAFPKNSIYTDTFERLTGFHRDAGLVQKWNQDVYTNYSVAGKGWMKTQRESEVFKSIDYRWKESQKKIRAFKLRNLTAVFVFLPISLTVAALAFGSELIYWRYVRNVIRHRATPSATSMLSLQIVAE